jgi:hypothetical protein
MLKYLTAGIVAASLLATPVLTVTAEAAQPATKTVLTTKPVAAKVVKHKRYAAVHRKHVKHARVWRGHKHHMARAGYWKWMKVHGKFVKVFIKKPAIKIVRKPATVFKKTVTIRKPAKVFIKKPVALKQAPAAKTTIAK